MTVAEEDRMAAARGRNRQRVLCGKNLAKESLNGGTGRKS